MSRARKLFRRCLAIDYMDGVTWQAYALLESRENNYDRAKELLMQGLEVDRRNPHLWNACGVVEQKLDNLR